MSRRFGRNQKRAMRSALEKMDRQLCKQIDVVSSLRNQMQNNEEALRLVASILGNDFVGLEPRTLHVDRLDRQHYQPPRMPLERLMDLAGPGELADAVACSVLEIEPNLARVAYYEEQIRFEFVTPGGDVTYGMSRQAWERMPSADQERMLRGEIAASMANHLIKSKGRR